MVIANMVRARLVKRFIAEPIFHFVLFGTVAALLYTSLSDQSHTIHISTNEQERLATVWSAEAGRQPRESDLVAMFSSYVEEEALSREALALGLDQGDTIIRRRLAQKMRFMLSDMAQITDPDEATLKQWYLEHADQFIESATVTFRHVFVAPESGREILTQLRAGVDWRSLGDPFMLRREYADVNESRLAAFFGATFAKQVFNLEAGKWSGPIDSVFGTHLVFLQKHTAARTHFFAEARGAVLNAWRDDQRRTVNRKKIQEIVERYNVAMETGQ